MPKEKGDMQAVTIWIKKDLVTQIDQFAEKGDLTRSKLISNLVEVGVEELTIMNKVGIWRDQARDFGGSRCLASG